VTELFLTRDAIADLDALPPLLAEDVAATIDALRLDPDLVGKQLRGRLSGLWVARVGSYRVLYTIEGPSRRATRVIVRAVRHRSVAYRTRRSI
jgi:mRNA-degrading endonuclease RelE of RelBE toxin-antitoxin system